MSEPVRGNPEVDKEVIEIDRKLRASFIFRDDKKTGFMRLRNCSYPVLYYFAKTLYACFKRVEEFMVEKFCQSSKDRADLISLTWEQFKNKHKDSPILVYAIEPRFNELKREYTNRLKAKSYPADEQRSMSL